MCDNVFHFTQDHLRRAHARCMPINAQASMVSSTIGRKPSLSEDIDPPIDELPLVSARVSVSLPNQLSQKQ